MKQRIGVIDALRGVILLCILLVHMHEYFGFYSYSELIPVNSTSYITDCIWGGIHVLLRGQCLIIFSVLFGISFYLILSKPQNSSIKFLWRCFLLFIFGILVKKFYTSDILMWFGLWGCFLVLFRYFKKEYLLFSFIVLFILDSLLSYLNIGNIINVDYQKYNTLSLQHILDYPLYYSVLSFIKNILNTGIFSTLGYFILGYYIAKTIQLNKLQEIINYRLLVLSLILYGLSFVFLYSFWCPFSVNINFMLGAFCYAIFFIYVYYKKPNFWKYFESYGKLGLTNYSFQGVFYTIAFCSFFPLYIFDKNELLIFSLVFWGIQMLFSVIWLHYFRYGPLEWVWRCMTDFKFYNNINNKLIGKR